MYFMAHHHTDHLSLLSFILFIDERNHVFRYCKFTLFADDLRL